MAVTPAFTAATTPTDFPAEVVAQFLKTAHDNSKAELQAMIDTHGPGIVHVTDAAGKSAIVHAAETSRMAAIELLLKYGAKIDQPDNNGNTALMGAAKRGFKGMVERLVKLGAKIDAANKRGRTPLMMAATHEVPDKTVPLLPKRKLETLKFLLDNGASLEPVDARGLNVEQNLVEDKFEEGLAMVRAEKQKRADIKADYDRRMNEAIGEMKNGIPTDVVAPERATFKKRMRSDFTHNARYSGLTGSRNDVVISGYVRRPSQRYRPSHI